jgi:hypothetical protein
MRFLTKLLAAGGVALMASGACFAQNVRNPNPAPVTVPAQPVAPNAGAAGDAGSGTTSKAAQGKQGTGSDNGGQLAGSDVPGGRNHAPAEGAPAQSFSAPIKKD